MGKRTFIGFTLLVGFFALVWWIGTLWNPDIDIEPSAEISIDTEEKLGRLILKSIRTNPQVQFIKNEELNAPLEIIYQRLLESVELTEYNYQFYLVDNSTVNAFALPGGHIFVYTGLIQFTDKPEELASVMAHEIGHIEQRHTVKKLVREFGLTLLMSIITGSDMVIIDDISKSIISTGFSRKFEREADEYGLELLEKSSINPHHMATLFRKMDRERGSYPESLEILSTHPHNNSRIKAALKYKIPEEFKEDGFNLDWEKIKEKLDPDQPTDNDMTGLLP